MVNTQLYNHVGWIYDKKRSDLQVAWANPVGTIGNKQSLNQQLLTHKIKRLSAEALATRAKEFKARRKRWSLRERSSNVTAAQIAQIYNNFEL